MKKTLPHNEDDKITTLLRGVDREISIAPTEVADKVLARIQCRRRGVVRLVATTSAILLALVSLIPVFVRMGKPDSRSLASRITSLSTNEVESDSGVLGEFQLTRIAAQVEESLEKLRKMKSELEQLHWIEHEQQMAFVRERLSQSIVSQTNIPFPIFIGD